MVKNKTRRVGFTIVELLIVVVVIAILASITVIAYSGIQSRTRTASYVAAVDSLEKQLRMAQVEGKLVAFNTNGTFICVGMQSDFPAITGLSAGQCSTTGNLLTQGVDSPVYANNAQIATLRSAGVTLTGKLDTIKGSSVTSRGLTIVSNESMIGIWWYPPDTSTCGRGSNETEALIALYKASPTLSAQMINLYGEDWESDVRTLYGGWCSLKIDK